MSYPHDDFVVSPDKGPPRLIRRQPADFFPTSDIVAAWDIPKNLLHVNASLFDQLPAEQQSRVLRTRNQFEYVNTPTFKF